MNDSSVVFEILGLIIMLIKLLWCLATIFIPYIVIGLLCFWVLFRIFGTNTVGKALLVVGALGALTEAGLKQSAKNAGKK